MRKQIRDGSDLMSLWCIIVNWGGGRFLVGKLLKADIWSGEAKRLKIAYSGTLQNDCLLQGYPWTT